MFLEHLKIRTKLTFLAGIPVFGALILSAMLIQNARQSARTAEAIGSIEDLAELSDRMRNVVSTLQTERAKGAWVTGQKLALANALESERTSTNTQLHRLEEFVSMRDQSKLPPRLARELSQARLQLRSLDGFRAEESTGSVTLTRQLDFYSAPIMSLIAATSALTELSDDGTLLRNISSLASTMELKERLSLQQALLAHVFALKDYPPGAFRRLVTLDTEEQIYRSSLSRTATEKHRHVLESAYSGNESKAAEAIKRDALQATDDEFAVDSKDWYASQAKRISALENVEKDFGNQVRNAALAKLASARQAVRVSVSFTVGVLIGSMLLALLIARGIARSVAALSSTAENVRTSKDFSTRAPRTSSDEIGKLADAFNEMLSGLQERDRELEQHRIGLERLVEERTKELKRRNSAMRLVLDHVAQGLATAGVNGVLAAECSAAFERWFGPPRTDAAFFGQIARDNARISTTMQLAFEQVVEGFLPVKVCLDMMPSRLEHNGRYFGLEYSPLMNGDNLDGLLLMVTDVTNAVQAELIETEQREQLRTFQRVLSDRTGFVEFFSDARTMIERIRDDAFENDAERRRIIHTLKGNSSLFEVETVVQATHQLEHALDEGTDEEIAQCREFLVDTWDGFAARTVPLLGEDICDRIELSRAELESLIELVHRGANHQELEAKIARLAFEPMRLRLGRIGSHLRGLAKRLGKAEPDVIISDGGVRLSSTHFAPLWNSFAHLIRNIVDHGIDEPEHRLSAGKPALVTVRLTASEDTSGFKLVVSDDGRGIDWERVRARAKNQGLPHATRNDLTRALLSPGFSTAATVTSTSGRGVGLSAVAAAVASLNGTLSIQSELGKGTSFSFAFSHSVAAMSGSGLQLNMRPISTAPRERHSDMPPRSG